MEDSQNVYIVDDETIIRRSIHFLLSGAGYKCYPFATGQEFLDAAEYLPAGWVLLDVHMPDLDGLAVQDRLIGRRSDMPIIFMTANGDIPTAVSAIKKGAFDFLQKPFADEALLALLESTREQVAEMARVERRNGDAIKRVSRLTSREVEVMRGLLQGGANKVVANALQISPRTVEMHRASIMRKMEVGNFAAAIQIALVAGLPTLS